MYPALTPYTSYILFSIGTLDISIKMMYQIVALLLLIGSIGFRTLFHKSGATSEALIENITLILLFLPLITLNVHNRLFYWLRPVLFAHWAINSMECEISIYSPLIKRLSVMTLIFVGVLTSYSILYAPDPSEIINSNVWVDSFIYFLSLFELGWILLILSSHMDPPSKMFFLGAFLLGITYNLLYLRFLLSLPYEIVFPIIGILIVVPILNSALKTKVER